MIDINELRRLAQAATPHVGHACKYQDAHWLREGHVDFENADLFIASERPQEDAEFYATANPATVTELLDRLEAAESDALEQARLNGMGASREAALMAKLEAAEKERAIDEQRIADLMAELNRVGQENEELRAKVEAMEKQGADTLMDLDGAQPAQKEVAYLDLGVGGYMDIGTDLTDEQLASLPKGRHMLGIVGTYGVDGYVSAQPAPSAPDGWKLVPIEPTPKMMRAAQKADHDHGNHEEWLEYDGEDVKRVYRAMLAAAPEAKPCP